MYDVRSTPIVGSPRRPGVIHGDLHDIGKNIVAFMLDLIDAGLIPMPLWEGDCTSRLK